MKIVKTMLACTLTLALHGVATAQIYESKDAEGVTEFSDEPSAGAEEVELGQTNVAAPVEAPPAQQPMQQSGQQERTAATVGGGTPAGEGDPEEPGYLYYGGDDVEELGPRAQRREDAARVDNRLPHEVDGQAREEAARQVDVARPDGVGEAGHPAEGEAAHHAGGRR